jgi:hypothetical protein
MKPPELRYINGGVGYCLGRSSGLAEPPRRSYREIIASAAPGKHNRVIKRRCEQRPATTPSRNLGFNATITNSG